MDPQNIYDNSEFFEGYKELRRSESGLNAALEQPAFLRMLPASLDGMRVLDLGCGFGAFARQVRALGAVEVIGVDISTKMLEEAGRQTSDPAIQYVQAALEDFRPEAEHFDLIASSLALHYIEDYRGLVKKIYAALKPGGHFVFSVEHPICTALLTGEWHCAPDGEILHWPVDRYRDEGERRSHWFVNGVLKYHRTMESYVNGLLEAGLVLTRLEEPEPTPQALAERPELARQCRRPPFLLLAARR